MFSITLGYGSITNLILFKYITFKENIFISYLSGSLTLAFLSIYINFFYPLNHILTNIICIIGCFLFLIKIFNTKKLLKIIYILLSISLIVTITSYLSYPYDDYTLYHLPYIEIIKSYKIIFGLSNLDGRLGTGSIFQNISSVFYNNLMLINSHIFYTPILVFICIYNLISISLKNISTINKIFILITIIFFSIQSYRYGNLGNDVPAHIISILCFIYFLLISNEKNNLINKDYYFIIFIILLIFSITAKITNILFVILFFFLIFRGNLLVFSKKFLPLFLFLFLLITGFTTKNFINTSCLYYPVTLTCFDTFWSSKNFNFADPYVVSIENSANAKDLMKTDFMKNEDIHKLLQGDINEILKKFPNANYEQQSNISKYVKYKEFNKFKNWTPHYFNNHFKVFLEKILIYSILIFIIIFTIFRKSISYNLFKQSYLNLFIICFTIFANIVWFIKFPLVRYGFSYLIILYMYIPLLFFDYKIINKSLFKKVLLSILSLLIIFISSSNINRIYNFDENLRDYHTYEGLIVPLDSIENQYKNFINGISVYSSNRVCSYSKQLCTIFYNRIINSNTVIYENNSGYLLITHN